MRHLLLLSCSATKRPDPGLLPARDRYDGPVYRVVRANRAGLDLAIWIVSAEFGFISEEHPLPLYDRRMTKARARELENGVSAALDELLHQERFASLFINLGKDYAFTLCSSVLLPQMRADNLVTEAHGGIGLRLRQTKLWLLSRVAIPSGLSSSQRGSFD